MPENNLENLNFDIQKIQQFGKFNYGNLQRIKLVTKLHTKSDPLQRLKNFKSYKF